MNQIDSLLEEGSIQILNPTAKGREGRSPEESPAVEQVVGDKLNHPLANRKAPMYVCQEEKPRHRAVIELAAKGLDNKEIAERLGISAVTVNYLVKQPHSEKLLLEEVRRIHGVDEEVVEIIKRNVAQAFLTFEDIMNNPEARDADRLAAAEKFVERRYGKANQPINRGTDVDLSNLPDGELAKMLANS